LIKSGQSKIYLDNSEPNVKRQLKSDFKIKVRLGCAQIMPAPSQQAQ
jgi:hypothetical protein